MRKIHNASPWCNASETAEQMTRREAAQVATERAEARIEEHRTSREALSPVFYGPRPGSWTRPPLRRAL